MNMTSDFLFILSFTIIFLKQFVVFLSYPFGPVSGAGAVEFIICHSEVSIAFVEEKKLDEVHTKLYILFPSEVNHMNLLNERYSINSLYSENKN